MLNKGHSQESENCANYSRSIPLNLLFGTPMGGRVRGTTSNSVPENVNRSFYSRVRSCQAFD